MKKIFTLLVSLCMVTFVMAQRPEAVIPKAGEVKPVIDGVLDEVWATVEQHNVDRPYTGETPSLGDEGETYWKALWDETGMYIIVVCKDDVWYPYSGTGDAWTFDKIELYFDTNYVLDDAVGGQASTTGNRQIAPDPDLEKLNGELKTQSIQQGDVKYAYKVDDPEWTTEWFIPWESIPDKNGTLFDLGATMGFDVSIADNDNDGAGRKRALWSNVGTVAENWSNMDDAGYITLEGVGASVEIEAITLSGATEITTDNGTVQLSATVAPENATQGYKWVITNETGMATVSKTGLVTALRNGTVKVTAVSANDFISSNEYTITISGQRISMDEINVLKNGHFTLGDNGKESWIGTSIGAAYVEDGFLNVDCTPKVNIWDTMYGQEKVNIADASTKYIVKFKAKASEDMTVPVVFEDRNNGNDKALTSASPYRGGENWQIPVTTEEQWFEFDVTFSNLKDNSAYELNFQVGMVTGTFSLADIKMYKESDLALVDPTLGTNTIAKSSIKVYPNPVSNTLYVDLKAINSKVAVYNAIGQKLMEKTSTGNKVTFDVSSLRKGMYFIKLEDGTTQKFIK